MLLLSNYEKDHGFRAGRIFVGYLAWWKTMAGVEFTLTNAGTDVLRAVTVEVTGRTYKLGDVRPGKSKIVKVNPTDESHIVVRFPTGIRMIVDCYLEPNYGGKISASVTSQAVIQIKDEVTLPFSF